MTKEAQNSKRRHNQEWPTGNEYFQLLVVIDFEGACNNNGQTVLNKVFMSFS
jgi:hypothetical protein